MVTLEDFLIRKGDEWQATVPVHDQASFFRLAGESAGVLINTQPQSQDVPVGSNATLRVDAIGARPLTYQWQFNGVDIEGATNSTLKIANAGLAQEGTYTVVLSNLLGSITSDPAILTLTYPPVIVEHPQNQTVRVGDTATFSVTVTNNATLPIGYRWRRNGQTLRNEALHQHTASYVITNAQLAHAGLYDVIVTNKAFSVPGFRSDPVTLTVTE